MNLVKLTPELTVAQYPYSIDELRQDHPETGFPDNLEGADLLPFNAALVVPMVPPSLNPVEQRATEVTPLLVDDQWLQQWVVEALPADMVAANQAALAAQAREAAKAQRSAVVEGIQVSTVSGRVFDGDETSQNRMVRAIKALEATGTPTTLWVLADNTSVQVSADELTEALVLAGQAQSEAWVLP